RHHQCRDAVRLLRADRVDVDDARRDDVARPRHGGRRLGRADVTSERRQVGARDAVLLADAPRFQPAVTDVAADGFDVQVEEPGDLLDGVELGRNGNHSSLLFPIYPPSQGNYRERSVIAGSTLAARQAGTPHAIDATAASSATTARYVTGSSGDTAKS